MSLVVLFNTYPTVSPLGPCLITSSETNTEGHVKVTTTDMSVISTAFGSADNPPVKVGVSVALISSEINSGNHPTALSASNNLLSSSLSSDIHPGLRVPSNGLVSVETLADALPKVRTHGVLTSANLLTEVNTGLKAPTNGVFETSSDVVNVVIEATHALITSSRTWAENSPIRLKTSGLLSSSETPTSVNPRVASGGEILAGIEQSLIFSSGNARGQAVAAATANVNRVRLGAHALLLADSSPTNTFTGIKILLGHVVFGSGATFAENSPHAGVGSLFLSSNASATGTTQGIPITGHIFASSSMLAKPVIHSSGHVVAQSLFAPTQARIGIPANIIGAAISDSGSEVNQARAVNSLMLSSSSMTAHPIVSPSALLMGSLSDMETSNFVPSKDTQSKIQAPKGGGEVGLDIVVAGFVIGPSL